LVIDGARLSCRPVAVPPLLWPSVLAESLMPTCEKVANAKNGPSWMQAVLAVLCTLCLQTGGRMGSDEGEEKVPCLGLCSLVWPRQPQPENVLESLDHSLLLRRPTDRLARLDAKENAKLLRHCYKIVLNRLAKLPLAPTRRKCLTSCPIQAIFGLPYLPSFQHINSDY